MTAKKTFVRNFVTHFLASYAATRYEMCCMTNAQSELSNGPIADAIELAEEQWERIYRYERAEGIEFLTEIEE